MTTRRTRIAVEWNKKIDLNNGLALSIEQMFTSNKVRLVICRVGTQFVVDIMQLERRQAEKVIDKTLGLLVKLPAVEK